jgi:prepilin-type N-terminal cleavage/methylation domain-containing protein
MNVQQKNKEKGFTIIEVVLVLAIAALIFLMVFIALPALQRSQRDTARKADVSSIAAAVTSSTGNQRGVFPTLAQLNNYINVPSNTTATGALTSANTTSILIRPVGGATANPAEGVVWVTPKSKCPAAPTTASAVLANGSGSQFTVVTKLESGGGVYFCLDS